jgi:phytoene dehydrogenase-like protein
LLAAAQTPQAETRCRGRYRPSASFLLLHLAIDAQVVPEGAHGHHPLLEKWPRSSPTPTG